MRAETIYKPEDNTYFGPNKPCMTVILDQKDWSKGGTFLLERRTFAYTLKPRAGYKIRKFYLVEVWEYVNGELCFMHQVEFKGKREAKKYFKEYVWDGNGNRGNV